MTTGSPVDAALESARATLRARQSAPLPPEWLAQLPDGDVTAESLEYLRTHTDSVLDESRNRLRRGPFTYDPALEGERIARSNDIVLRVRPGLFEDPNYFSLLAYQAASTELAWEELVDEAHRGMFSKYLIGTAHAADINAIAEVSATNDYTVVLLNSGLVDFIYQSAKSVIEIMAPEESDDPHYLVKTSLDLDKIAARIRPDSPPVERLYDTLEAYFFRGYPRAHARETVPPVQQPPLSLLVSFAERWAIGHEYAHGLKPSLDGLPSAANRSRVEEFFADDNATITTVLSACGRDGVSPEFPLGGAVFALACLDLRRRGFNILLTGDEAGIDDPADDHPLPADRIYGCIDCFRRSFDVEYGERGFDLWRVLRKEVPQDHGFTAERADNAYEYANVLYALWRPVKDRLLEDYRHGRPLHPMWA